MDSLTWLYLAAIGALYGLGRFTFKNALMPVVIARPWGRFHFACWWPLLWLLYRFGHRVTPWKEIRPGVWLGKCLLPDHLPVIKRLGITRILNLQDENVGPTMIPGLSQLHVPVIDHMEPTPQQIEIGVAYIEGALRDGTGVYVHCQGGHGRSAAIVFAWLCREEQHKTPMQHNAEIYATWKVRKGLHSQPSVTRFLNQQSENKK